MSPSEALEKTPYLAVFCRAISWRMLIVSWSTPPKPNVKMTTELLSSRFLSLIVWKIAFLSSEGAPSVRNKITFRFGLPASSDLVPFRRLKAFSKANRYCVSPKDKGKKKGFDDHESFYSCLVRSVIDICWSAEREAASSNPGRTKIQDLFQNNLGESASFIRHLQTVRLPSLLR